MKNHSENSPGKTGGAGGASDQGYANLMDDALRLGAAPSAAPAAAPAAAQGRAPTLGRYALVLVIVGPLALLYLLLGLAAQVLRAPSALVYMLAYGVGSVVKMLTSKIMGQANLPPHH